MANTLLTPTKVTRKALMILHQKLNFIGTINRSYDDQYAKDGAKIGSQLKIRLPNRYEVTTGAVMTAQDTSESSVTLTVATQKHVGMNFTTADLTLSLDDFSERIIEPAMAVLAANIEADAMNMYQEVYNQYNATATTLAFKDVGQVMKILTDNLTPNSKRYLNMNTTEALDFIDAAKGLFHESTAIEKQYREGLMGRTMRFDAYENTLWPLHTAGTDASAYLTNGASQTGATLTVDTGSGTFEKGDIITVADVFRVHPESKVSTGQLQQFVVTSDVAGSATSIPISPSIVASGASQNVSAAAGDGKAITKVGGNAEDYRISMGYHRDAFAFATADLVMPKGVDFSAREVFDGISMRLVRDYDINNDKLPCRVDVLYGYKATRPELACRLGSKPA